ncbi:MAG: cytidine deaminase [Burkholderiales bacterium]|jgi:cytidine deaminase|nr:cytidine deaminase [Burkholderiales bacterium]
MKFEFEYEVYDSITELAPADQDLVNKAFEATKLSYSPYSKLKVGVCAITNKGNVVVGSNQENGSYSVTICAERVLLSTLSAQHPGEYITTIAISYLDWNNNSDKPITPCGVCRQAILEHQIQHKCNVRVILSSKNGQVYVIKKGSDLLPLPFSI